jgi:hypothetical protein
MQVKFDYFLCGVAGALFAYIAQTYTPQKLDNAFSILQFASLLTLALSFYFGVKRIQTANMVTRLNYNEWKAGDAAEKITKALQDAVTFQNDLTGDVASRKTLESERAVHLKEVSECKFHAEKESQKARRFGAMQLYFLLGGFLIILSAKVFQPYEMDFSRHSAAITQTTNTPAQSPVGIQTNKPAQQQKLPSPLKTPSRM